MSHLSTNFHSVTSIYLWGLCTCILASCRFPQFLKQQDPWIGDDKDGRIVAYVKPTLISLNEGNIQITRECLTRHTDNKFLIMHREEGQSIKYLCMQFLQRGNNIVQIKSSDLSVRQTIELCEESRMTIEPSPWVYSGQTLNSSITCPFTGGYNIHAYYPHPNNSEVCNNLLLLMRMESECDQGEGITFDFRREECVPKDLPQKHIQRALCVAHWTQDNYTFIILQHAEANSRWFCLRTSDPLNNIKNAYLWLKVICDTSDRPSLEVSQNYLRLELSKRIFSSTCADELELCPEMNHYCSMPFSRHCAHTCDLCISENQIGVCTFEEQYRGSWIESGSITDVMYDIQAYSLFSGPPGKYDCLNLDSETMPNRRVLLDLYSNGCFPRYACLEMEKVTSSVMKFRLGDRLTWPLPNLKKQKEEICKSDNFKTRERFGSRSGRGEKPARLLVNTGNIKEIYCDLPVRVQNGIAFREDGNSCGGCLNYEPHISPNHFTISPINCTAVRSDHKDYGNIPIQYGCLATFWFHNNTFAVVTKTLNFVKAMGQYLVWMFTPDNHIKVLKAADTFIYEQNSMIKSEMIQAQFTILRNDNLQCRNFFFLPRTTITTTSSLQRKESIPDSYNSKSQIGDIKNDNYASGPTINGDDYLPYSPESKDDSQVNSPKSHAKYDNTKEENLKGVNSSNFMYANATYFKIILAFLVLALITQLFGQISNET